LRNPDDLIDRPVIEQRNDQGNVLMALSSRTLRTPLKKQALIS
jgi:hypothetical protein